MIDAEMLLLVLRALNEHEVAYRVVGGVALNLQGLPRATADLDIFVSASEDNVARLRSALHAVFQDADIEQISAADLGGDYPAVQYVPPTGAFHIDILARLGERFTFEDIESEELEIEGIKVPVATPRMLYRMKRDTVRLQDRADAERLRKQYRLKDEGG